MDPAYDKTISVKSVNTSGRTWISLVLFICSNVFYGVFFIMLIRTPLFEDPWDGPVIYLYFVSTLFLFLTVVDLQRFFSVQPDREIVQRSRKLEGNDKSVGTFHPVCGFRRSYRYMGPFLLYLGVFLTFTVYLYIPWIQKGWAHFHYRGSSLFFALLFWVLLSPIGIIPLLTRYTTLSSFLDIYPGLLVFRKRFTTYYVPAMDLERIIFYTRGASLYVISFKIKEGKELWFPMKYLKNRTQEIKNSLGVLNDVQSRSAVLRKNIISISTRTRPSTGRAFGRVSRW